MTLFMLNGEARSPAVGVPYANMGQRRGRSTPVFGIFSPSMGDVFDPAIDATPVILSGVEGAVTLNIDSADFAAFGSPADEPWDGEDLEAGGIAISKMAALSLVEIWARLADGSARTVLEPSDADIGRVGMQQQVIVAAPFAENASLTAALDLGVGRLVAIQVPPGWQGVSISFDVSFDGATYAPLYDDQGQEKLLTVAASRMVICNPADFLGVRRLKVRSGPVAAPVNQTAARSLQLITQP